MMNRRIIIFKILSLCIFLILGTWLFFHFDLHVYFTNREKGIAFIESFGHLSVFIFILLQIAQVIAAPIPGEATGIIGGYIYGPFLGTIYSTIGLTIGSWLAFMLSRLFGMPLVEKVVKKEVIDKYDYFMEHQGAVVSFLLFLIPGFPKDYLCYIMGVSHMPVWEFLTISTIGRLMGTALLSVSGSCARNDQYAALIVISVVSGILFILAVVYHDKLLAFLKNHIKKGKDVGDKEIR
jgi:uncharacterized membrane protein YdjX (TVP38/TMEM64 family)